MVDNVTSEYADLLLNQAYWLMARLRDERTRLLNSNPRTSLPTRIAARCTRLTDLYERGRVRYMRRYDLWCDSND